MNLGVIRSRPTDYSKVTVKNMGKSSIILIYLTFIHGTCKFKNRKQYFLSENYEQSFPNKKHKQSRASGKHK
jgi:hypothetical protein